MIKGLPMSLPGWPRWPGQPPAGSKLAGDFMNIVMDQATAPEPGALPASTTDESLPGQPEIALELHGRDAQGQVQVLRWPLPPRTNDQSACGFDEVLRDQGRREAAEPGASVPWQPGAVVGTEDADTGARDASRVLRPAFDPGLASPDPYRVAAPPGPDETGTVMLHAPAEGRPEAVTFAWRLAATGRLGQAGAIGAALPPADPGVPMVASAGTPPQERQAPSRLSTLPPSPQEEAGNGRLHLGRLPPSIAPGTPPPAIAGEGAVDLPLATPAHAAPWVGRVVRWLQQEGQAPAIWVRDYRLDRDAATQVVEQLRAHAREQGIELERIVVNARELWRAAPRNFDQEPTDAR